MCGGIRHEFITRIVARNVGRHAAVRKPTQSRSRVSVGGATPGQAVFDLRSHHQDEKPNRDRDRANALTRGIVGGNPPIQTSPNTNGGGGWWGVPPYSLYLKETKKKVRGMGWGMGMPPHVNREARIGGIAPDRGGVRSAALGLARKNQHRMTSWKKVPTPIRGEEVWVAWCHRCGAALIWRSRVSLFARRVEGDVMAFVCRPLVSKRQHENKT